MARKAGDGAEFLTSRTLFGMTGLGAASGTAEGLEQQDSDSL